MKAEARTPNVTALDNSPRHGDTMNCDRAGPNDDGVMYEDLRIVQATSLKSRDSR